MKGIPISVIPPTPEGRLYPRYQNSIGILTLSAGSPGPHAYGINIDGTLVLDFDEAGVLVDVELLLPISRWKSKASASPPSGAAGNLVLPTMERISTSYAWSITVSKNVQTGAARIDFGNGDHDRSVKLSEACWGLLVDDTLVGFWFAIPL